MKVVIVDDDPIVSQSLKMILEGDQEIMVSAMGRDGNEAVRLYRINLPDVLLMDIRMETMNGLDAAKILLKEFPNARILFLTTFSDNDYIIQALNIGAKGYILKQDFESIVPAIKAIYMGQSVFGGKVVEKLPAILEKKSGFDYKKANINEKELEIIELVAKGLNNKEISEQIYLSEGTIRNYLSAITEKLHVRDRTQLAIFYLTNRQK